MADSIRYAVHGAPAVDGRHFDTPFVGSTRLFQRLFGVLGPLAVCLSTLTGCIERTVSITSQPSGALVHLNDEEVGRTPVTVPFTFYGVYDVRLEKQGYQSLWTTTQAKAPWWEAPGPDLVAEAIPDLKVELQWHYELKPVAAADEEALIDRASQLRDQASTPTPQAK